MERSINLPNRLQLAAGLGLAWNLFGIVQFFGQSGASEAVLMNRGMTATQAAVTANLPSWMTMAFAVGVFGGSIGCLLLLASQRAATAVLTASLAAYVILYAGDIVHGMFAAFGPSQVAILSLVVAIAAALLMLSIVTDRRRAGR